MILAKLDERRRAKPAALDPLFGFTRNVMQVLHGWFGVSLTPLLAEKIANWFKRICTGMVRSPIDHVECASIIAQTDYGFGVPKRSPSH